MDVDKRRALRWLSPVVLAALCALLGGALPCRAAKTGTAVWTVPPPDTLTPEASIVVKGYLKKKPSGLVSLTVKHLETNSTENIPVALTLERFFSATVPLKPGQSDLILQNSVLSVLSRPGSDAATEGKFARATLHAAAVKECTACHWVWDGDLTLNSELPQLCLGDCHEVGTESSRAAFQKNEHLSKLTPFCVGCHDPHGGRQPRLIKREGNDCLRCHTEMAKGVGHESAGVLSCTLCHDPHRSGYPLLLRGDIEPLCASCHNEISKRQRDSASSHKSVTDGKCLTCHVSHSTGEASLLVQPVATLCASCHEPKDPLGHTGKLEDCMACHVSHQSRLPRLLNADAARSCLTCHEDRKTLRHGDLGPESCATCHNPHKTVAEEEGDRCAKCHSFSSSSFGYAHGSLPLRRMEQCTLCHDPHGGSDETALLYGKTHYPAKNGGCGVCHTKEGGSIGFRYLESESCYRCHGETIGIASGGQDERIHKPVAEDACTACHDPHVASRPKMLLDKPLELCLLCHGATLAQGRVEHKALPEKGCLACHVAHFSDHRPLLTAEQPVLCAECHPEAVPPGSESKPLAHRALRGGRCGGCHEPHRSDESKLIRGGADDACKNCHPKVLLDEKGNPWSDLHGPVGSGSCTACHDLAHMHERNAEDAFLTSWPPSSICEECHDVVPAHIPPKWRSRSGKNPEDCLGCHEPHGAANMLMLKRIAY